MKKKKEPEYEEFVRCPECGHEQPDMGRNVLCEECNNATMPCYVPKNS